MIQLTFFWQPTLRFRSQVDSESGHFTCVSQNRANSEQNEETYSKQVLYTQQTKTEQNLLWMKACSGTKAIAVRAKKYIKNGSEQWAKMQHNRVNRKKYEKDN